MKKLLGIFTVFTLALTSAVAFAADPVPPVDFAAFLAQVMELINNFGGLSWMAKVSGIVMLLIGSMKVTPIRAFIWDKIPVGIQPFLAPGLGLIAGLIMIQPLTFASAFAYIMAGSGAIIMYELLDAIKLASAANATVTMVISFIQSILKTGK